MAEPADSTTVPVPWSARAPQRYVFAALAVIIGNAVVVTAIAYIMITVGPVLAVVYVYYFGFRKFDAQD